MQKVTKLVLILCFVLSGAFCYVFGAARTENEKGRDGTPIEVIEALTYSGLDKSSAIVPILNGHVLFVTFTENLGQVAIEVTTASGAYVECLSTPTPNGVQIYIPQAGDYVITFTLPNGDEYYGEFTVTD